MAVLSPENKPIGIGKERSKKKAEQLASKEALKHYKMLEESDTDSELSSDSDE